MFLKRFTTYVACLNVIHLYRYFYYNMRVVYTQNNVISDGDGRSPVVPIDLGKSYGATANAIFVLLTLTMFSSFGVSLKTDVNGFQMDKIKLIINWLINFILEFWSKIAGCSMFILAKKEIFTFDKKKL